MAGNHKYVNCHECRNYKVDRGRGLCWACKKRLKEEGTLDEKYPPLLKRYDHDSNSYLKPEKKKKPKDRKNLGLKDGRWVKTGPGISSLVWMTEEEINEMKQGGPESSKAS